MKLEAIGRNRKGDSLWRVVEPFKVRIGPGINIKVPEGYVSNLGTIPRVPGLRAIISPDDAPMPFVVHDWLCGEDWVDDGEDIDSGHSRWVADSLLYELMVRDGVAAWRCWIVWLACRIHARLRNLK